MTLDDEIELLREGYRLLNDEKRIDASQYTDDFVLEQSQQLPGTRGTFRGPVGVEASLGELLSGLDDLRFEPQGFEPYRGWWIVPVTWWATARGVEQRIEIWHIWQFRDGRPARLRVLGGGTDPRREIDKLSQ